MTILTYGISYKNAPIAIREQWSVDEVRATAVLQDMKQHAVVDEAVILSTCNRTEIYTTEESSSALESWLERQKSPLEQEALQRYIYVHRGIDAIQHAMRVASGLDSAVLGEPQILGQMKRAYRLACEAGMVGRHLQCLFPAVFSASKAVRHHTGLNCKATSLVHKVLQLVQRVFPVVADCRILLIGSGEMMRRTAAQLRGYSKHPLTVAGRQLEHARCLAALYKGRAICLSDVSQSISDVDIVISATSSPAPILAKEILEVALRSRERRRPLLMIDLAMPRDIEPGVADLEGVLLYHLDDLQQAMGQEQDSARPVVQQAETMIVTRAEHHLKQFRVLDASATIAAYRARVESLRDQVLEKALFDLKRGEESELVLESLARNLINKVLHQPTLKLRQAAYNNQLDLLQCTKQLFDIES